MFNAYLLSARNASDPPHFSQPSETRRNLLAASFKSRIEKQLIEVLLTQTALQVHPNFHSKRVNVSFQAQDSPVNTTKGLDRSQVLSFKAINATARLNSTLPSTRSKSIDRSAAQRYEKTLISLELGLHAWQEAPTEREIKEKLRQEKLGKIRMKPKKDWPLVLREQGLVTEVLKQSVSPRSVVLTKDQKMRLSGELLGRGPPRAFMRRTRVKSAYQTKFCR